MTEKSGSDASLNALPGCSGHHGAFLMCAKIAQR
jgi:hypothetical protein